MPVRVLIVDDDPVFRATIRGVLRERGYRVVGEAASVREARVAVSELSPDAVLLDVNLPDGNGFRLAEELEAVRVLLTSSDASAAPARLVRRAGAGFIAKTELIASDLGAYLGRP